MTSERTRNHVIGTALIDRPMLALGAGLLLLAATVALLAPGADGVHVRPTQPQFDISEAQPEIPWGGRAGALAIAPGDADSALAVSDTGGLFSTFDGGDSWNPVDGLPAFRLNDAEYGPDGDVRLVTARFDARNLSKSATTYPNGTTVKARQIAGSGIWVDPGDGSWYKPDTAEPVEDCPGNHDAGRSVSWGIDRMGGVFYVGTDCGLAVSDDDGATWDHMRVAGANRRVWSVDAHHGVVDICSTAGHLRYDPSDGSWTDPGLDSCAEESVSSIAASPDEADILFRVDVVSDSDCGDGNRMAVFESPDGGATWFDLAVPTCSESPDEPFVATPPVSDADGEFDLWAGDGFHLFIQRDCVPRVQRPIHCQLSKWSELSHGLDGEDVSHADVTDIAFPSGARCPKLLGHHGGVDRTSDCGESWELVGSSRNGFHALQLYEVAGQIYDNHTDLYIGSQDNDIWARDDEGDWSGKVQHENGGLEMARRVTNHDPQVITGTRCAPCRNFQADAHFEDRRSWSDPPDRSGIMDMRPGWNDNEGPAPLLVEPGVYVQKGNGTAGEIWWSEDDDRDWNLAVDLPRPIEQGMELAGPADDPTLYVPVERSGAGAGLFKVTDLRGSGTGTAIRADKGMRIASDGRGFQWSRLLEPDPDDPDHLLVSSWNHRGMNVSNDGGNSWDPLAGLTDLVTDEGDQPYLFDTHKAGNDCCSQVSQIAFDPDNPDRIFVGTQARGIFVSVDGGERWFQMPNSEQIPIVTGFFFDTPNDQIYVSSYGRGLWEIDMSPPPFAEDTIEHKPDLEPDRFEENDEPADATPRQDLERTHDHVERTTKGGSENPFPWDGIERWTWTAEDLTLHDGDDVDYFRIPLPDPENPPTLRYTDVPAVHPGMPECGSEEFDVGGDLIDSMRIEWEGHLRVTMDGVPSGNSEDVRLYDAAREERLPFHVRCPRTDGIEEVFVTVGEDPGLHDVPVRNWFVDYDLTVEYWIDVTYIREASEEVKEWARGESHRSASSQCPDGGQFAVCVAREPTIWRHLPDRVPQRGCWADGPGCPMTNGFAWGSEQSFRMRIEQPAIGPDQQEPRLDISLLDAEGETIGKAASVQGGFSPAETPAQQYAGDDGLRLQPPSQQPTPPEQPNDTQPEQPNDTQPGPSGGHVTQELVVEDLSPGYYILRVDGPPTRFMVQLDEAAPLVDRDLDGIADIYDTDPDRANAFSQGAETTEATEGVTVVLVAAVVLVGVVGVASGWFARERW